MNTGDMRWDIGFFMQFYSTIIDFLLKPPYTGTGYSNTKLRMMHVSTRTGASIPKGHQDRGLGGVLSELAGKLSGLRSYRFSSVKMPNNVATPFPSCRCRWWLAGSTTSKRERDMLRLTSWLGLYDWPKNSNSAKNIMYPNTPIITPRQSPSLIHLSRTGDPGENAPMVVTSCTNLTPLSHLGRAQASVTLLLYFFSNRNCSCHESCL